MKSSRRWASALALLAVLACRRSPEPVKPVEPARAAPAPRPPAAAPVQAPAPPAPVPAVQPTVTPAPPPPITEEPAPPERSAEEVMRDIERGYRATPRAVRMDILTTRVQTERVGGMPPREELLLWGIANGDPEKTAFLYAFFQPRRFRGTGLLIEDAADSREGDTLWYHMRTYRRFQHVPQTSLRLLVAGTCMTYEDARGFTATDRYEFRFTAPNVILARPLTPELESGTGYKSIEIHVDPEKSFVREIRFTGLNDRPFKVYTAGEPVRLGDAWLPGTARIEDLQSAVVSTIRYRYWPLKTAPPAALYDTEVEDRSLLERLAEALAVEGIEAEPSEPADATVPGGT